MSLYQSSLQRMRAAAYESYGLSNLDEYMVKNTFINQKPFSFKDREFQIDILKDTARTSIIVKCAQVGLSELAYRWAVCACCVRENFTVVYTFPTTSDAELNNRMRIDPMITGSPELARLVNPDMNNSSVKQFGENSFLLFKGTISKTAALSTPANAVVNDEYDKSDLEQASVYVSRLQDREDKIRKLFSTPTFANYGIDKEAQTAKRYRHHARCNCCNHVFLPDYFSHVRVPGWNLPLEDITKQNIHLTRWQEAELLCPKCGRNPQLHYSRMEFVCENISENHSANAWFVSPFSAHKRITIPYIVEASTKFKKYSEFKNQTLGITGEEESDSITEGDIDKMQSYSGLESSNIHQIGADIGITCHIAVGREAENGEMLVVKRVRVHYTQFEAKLAELARQYRVNVKLIDSQPYSDMITRICGYDVNAWGGIFVNTKNPANFVLKEFEEDEEKAKLEMRLANINRNVALDDLLAKIKAGQVLINSSEDNEIFKKQLTSLKRKMELDANREMKYVWVKTGEEDDHYHFAMLYLMLAIQMRKVAGTPGIASTGIPLVQKLSKPKVWKRTSSGIYF